MKLRFCPFSMAVFASTAIYVTRRQRRLAQQKQRATTTFQVVFVLGGPGAGKGTQCELLVQRLGDWAHLSAGDLLRAERKKGGPLGDLINAKIASGQLVPSEVTCQLLANAMQEGYDTEGITKFLIDGYPRSHGNVDAWNKLVEGKEAVSERQNYHLAFVLYFTCPEEVLTGRLLQRGQGRVDDTVDVIRKRFQTFERETQPILSLYGDQVKTIAADKPVEEVYKEVSALFENL